MQNDRFWTRIFSQNILTQHYNYLEKLSVILSFPPKLQTIRIQTFFQTNPYNTLRIGLHDKLPNLTLFFTPTWFSDIFFTIFGYPCCFLTNCGIFLHFYNTSYKTISNNFDKISSSTKEYSSEFNSNMVSLIFLQLTW